MAPSYRAPAGACTCAQRANDSHPRYRRAMRLYVVVLTLLAVDLRVVHAGGA
jgi:hypothetical protein